MGDKFKGCEDYFNELGDCILNGGAYKATKYISPKLTIKATRKRFKGKVDNRDRVVHIVFTAGGPNYEERQFIKKAKQINKNTGEMSFPIDGIVAKF